MSSHPVTDPTTASSQVHPRTVDADRSQFCASRRSVLRALGAAGVVSVSAGVLLAACGGSESDAAVTPDAPADSPDAGPDQGASSDPVAGEANGDMVALADVPVGEAVVVNGAAGPVVVARLGESEAVAFSATCTHAGTTVEVADGFMLRCPNHGSEFDAEDGSVLQGPAGSSLTELTATISGDNILIS